MFVYDRCGCRILKEERNYILQMIKKIRASGCNVVLIQKSILRDAVTDLSLHYLVRHLLPFGCVNGQDLYFLAHYGSPLLLHLGLICPLTLLNRQETLVMVGYMA